MVSIFAGAVVSLAAGDSASTALSACTETWPRIVRVGGNCAVNAHAQSGSAFPEYARASIDCLRVCENEIANVKPENNIETPNKKIKINHTKKNLPF